MPHTFIALYRGQTIGSARVVAVSADPDVVIRFADELLQKNRRAELDPIMSAVDEGRREALQLVRDEAEEEASLDGEG